MVIQAVVLMEAFLVFRPCIRIVVEHTCARTFIFNCKGIFRGSRRSNCVIQFTKRLHVEHLITPEQAVNRYLHRVAFFVVRVRLEVIDGGIRHRFITDEVVIDSTESCIACHRERTAEALTRIGIRD